MILDKFEEPLKILQAEGITLGIENESSTYIGTGGVLKRFLNELQSPHVAAIWDPCNVVFDDLVKEVPYPDGYNAIKDKMVHFHLKDAMRDKTTGKPFCTKIGEGEIDFKGQFQALVKDKYEAYVSLETHWRPKSLTEEEMNRPGGSSFSKEGEFASRVCLDNWNRLMKAIR
jgi:sugar phosphate isomerase/epimerase